MATAENSFQGTLEQPEAARGGCMIRVPFDPRETFGKVRAPVKAYRGGCE